MGLLLHSKDNLGQIFDSCPTPVVVEFQGSTIYRNEPAKRLDSSEPS